MKLRWIFSTCAVALMALCVSQAQADNAIITLEYASDGTWDLFAEVEDTGSGVDGSFGISAVRALVDDIDFGTDGDAVEIAEGIGAINPVPTANGDRPPVLQMDSGTLDIIYGQNIADAPSVVTGVGVGSRTLIAEGTYSIGTPPSAGMDGALASQVLFLSEGAGPFSGTVDADMTTFNVVMVGGPDLLPGDFDSSGTVGGDDLSLLLTAWGGAPGAGWTNNVPETVGGDSLSALLTTWGQSSGSGLLAPAAVPEPTTMAFALLASVGGLAMRRTRV